MVNTGKWPQPLRNKTEIKDKVYEKAAEVLNEWINKTIKGEEYGEGKHER